MNHKIGMQRALFASEGSHDPDTQTGCAIYNMHGFVVSGTNRLPSRIKRTEERTTRPGKYLWLEHAERCAIYNHGGELEDTVMFLNWFPCADCARAIVAVGISELVYIIKADRLADPRYGFETSRAILEAGGVKLTEYVDV